MVQRPNGARRADVKVPAGIRRETVERMTRPEVASRELVDSVVENFIDASHCRLFIPGVGCQRLVALCIVKHPTISCLRQRSKLTRGSKSQGACMSEPVHFRTSRQIHCMFAL